MNNNIYMPIFIENNREYYKVIEEVKHPFRYSSQFEVIDYIILHDGEIIYFSKLDNIMFNIEMMILHIDKIERTNFYSYKIKEKSLNFFRETLSKMIAYEREIKIDDILDKTNKEIQYV